MRFAFISIPEQHHIQNGFITEFRFGGRQQAGFQFAYIGFNLIDLTVFSQTIDALQMVFNIVNEYALILKLLLHRTIYRLHPPVPFACSIEVQHTLHLLFAGGYIGSETAN